MALAIFDLDNTLIAGDSDYLWGQYLVERGLVERESYERANAGFYEDYKSGCLDIQAFLEFALAPLSRHPTEQLEALRAEFVQELILPILLPAARQLIEAHRREGRTPLIITATNAFVTQPIAALYGIENLLATQPEQVQGRYTGRVSGMPCFREGKVTRLMQWIERSGHDLHDSWFYSDSHNDLPLMDVIAHPIAVDPDETLRREAHARGWGILSLRTTHCDADHLLKVAVRD